MVGNTSPAKGNTTNSNHGNGPVYNKTLNNDKSSALNNDKSSAFDNTAPVDKSSASGNAPEITDAESDIY
eukprot:Nk52_evm1s887 gene=Nk52_evmTU1s887